MVDDEVTFEQIVAALRARVPGREDSDYRIAALRVYFNLESAGPVDRLVDEDRSDADILIDRTLLEIAERNASRGVVR